MFETSPLGTDPHRDAERLCRLGQMKIDIARDTGAAGHAGKQQRCGKSLPEKRSRQVCPIEIRFRKSDVVKTIVFKASGQPFG